MNAVFTLENIKETEASTCKERRDGERRPEAFPSPGRQQHGGEQGQHQMQSDDEAQDIRDVGHRNLWLAFLRRQVAGDHTHGGGFAGAVWAKKAEHFPLFDFKGHPVHGPSGPEVFN